ncbi:4-hydroxythreonine-4-phosphate dehydrogenase PdxA [Dissulfurirhabdus thermomarina]|uniref:4-hydroxythreonine-4-phosphate dehydrogenase PdxA n=2 Tax=Dissulfurirhabdus thermomarina TaxID=1765737 RepID=A0A6N9TT80_DISTH|nr:4-hydroxythreonine-4-phosphate dehydrogenase PdxA [Dissulfurirhabdus thermomarina]NDY43293.1 4-hydroxythreonine-4-phosphate dehydrogenase PdxA [Dissulfurirhabdus thermomarina]NMX24180.1 4-hydroxythreonine-4-phosphate dehydrogenase PdxA [Dissulfurirhabdus thermomarina]
MGCPAGVGPEVVLKAFARRPGWRGRRAPVVLGDPGVLRRTAAALGLPFRPHPWRPGDAPPAGAIPVVEVTRLGPGDFRTGTPNAATGAASHAYVLEGLRRIRAGELSGIVTAPISKLGLRLAGIPFPGHTEILADFTGCRRYAMMLSGRRLRVVLCTIHCALAEVPGRLDTGRVLETIRLADQALRCDFGLERPRVAVAGLNPHAGEAGMFGDEEERIIGPAVAAARAEGIDASGPHPPDTVFYLASRGRFDVVVAQYHDQGLIPLKLLHFRDGVNVTLGLPLVRTSVDHGTAYDIAGTGAADPSSLLAAVATARTMVRHRRRAGGRP